MRFLVNPMASVRRHGKPVGIKAWKASGYRRNPTRKTRKRASPKQLAARKKFAALARARAKVGGTHRARTKPKGTIMARRKRRTAAARRSTRRKRSPARRVMHHNPKRRRRVIRHHAKRRRTFRRNPGMGGMLGQVTTLFKESGVALLGMAAGRTISNLIPIAETSPLIAFAKGTVVAIGIRMLGEKVIGRDLARVAAIGAMLMPVKNLVVGYFPTASTFLGSYAGNLGGVMAMPRIPARSTVTGYDGNAQTVGSYASDGY
jgi:hypothetical protein